MKSDDELSAVFAALAHETRRRILDLLRTRAGAGVGEIAAEFDISRVAIMKHIAVLEEANLVASLKEGRTRRLFFNGAPIRMIYDRWTDVYAGCWAGAATRPKRRDAQRNEKAPARRSKQVKSR